MDRPLPLLNAEEYGNPLWADMRVDYGELFTGVGQNPTLVTYRGTRLYEFAVGDVIGFLKQFPHSYVEESDLQPHIHWNPAGRGVTEDGNTVLWQIQYSIAPVYGVFPALSSWLDMFATCNGIDDRHEVAGADEDIDGTGLNISSIIMGTIRRAPSGDTWTGTGTGNLPLLLELDFHILKDIQGSLSPFNK